MAEGGSSRWMAEAVLVILSAGAAHATEGVVVGRTRDEHVLRPWHPSAPSAAATDTESSCGRQVRPPTQKRWDNPSSAPSPSVGTTRGICRLASLPLAVPSPAQCRKEFRLISWGQSAFCRSIETSPCLNECQPICFFTPIHSSAGRI